MNTMKGKIIINRKCFYIAQKIAGMLGKWLHWYTMTWNWSAKFVSLCHNSNKNLVVVIFANFVKAEIFSKKICKKHVQPPFCMNINLFKRYQNIKLLWFSEHKNRNETLIFIFINVVSLHIYRKETGVWQEYCLYMYEQWKLNIKNKKLSQIQHKKREHYSKM